MSNDTQKGETLEDAARRLLAEMDARKKASERPQNGSEKFDNVVKLCDFRGAGARTDVPPYCPGTFSQVRG